MFQRSTRVAVVALLAAGSLTAIAPTAWAGGPNVVRDGGVATAQADVDTGSAIVRLQGDPISVSTKVNRSRKNRVDLDGAATKSVRAQLSAQRNEFKKWLQVNAPKVQITGSYDISLNAVAVKLNGTPLATVAAAPQAAGAQLQAVYRKLTATPVDPDLALIGAVESWGGGGAAGAGKGVKVGIIDSGIDQRHPCFDGLGDPDGPNNFTNGKVIIAKVFNNKAGKGRYTPEAIDSHGTHVAGTVACDVDTVATVDGAAIPHTISGVAPAARLGNYNVFPGTVEDARDEDILNALDAAYADGMDVVNMSLGGGYKGNQDLTSNAVDNLDRAGMVIAVAAGNEGPGPSTVGSPGRAERALTAGASTVPHNVLNTLTVNGNTVKAALGEFAPIALNQYPFTGTLDVVTDSTPDLPVPGISLACAPIPKAATTGLIAVVARGVCDFSVKVTNVQDAGYTAAVVVNRLDGRFTMGNTATDTTFTIPAVMVSLSDRAVVAVDGATASLGAPAYMADGTANEMADFTSEGPTRVDARIKPDVTAPGVNVLSSIPGGKFAFFNGTSMATPHLAGAAAVVLGRFPDLQPWQVRSAIVNSADQGATIALTKGQANDDPNLVGSGLLDLPAAVGTTTFLSQVSVSFGTIPSGSGQKATRTFTVTNAAGALVAATPVLSGATAPWFTVSGGTGPALGTVTVAVAVPKGSPNGGAWATVRLSTGQHLRVYVRVG
jgi:subtilisin family serine protease